MNEKIYIYLDRDSGKTIGIQSIQKPKSGERMYKIFVWSTEEDGYVIANFSEISSKRLLFIGERDVFNILFK